jgi:hypothetical protein
VKQPPSTASYNLDSHVKDALLNEYASLAAKKGRALGVLNIFQKGFCWSPFEFSIEARRPQEKGVAGSQW